MYYNIRNRILKNHDNWLKNKKVIQSQNVKKMPKKLKIFNLKIHKGAEIKKETKTFLNKGAKHKQNYMEGLNSKNENIKGGRSLKHLLLFRIAVVPKIRSFDLKIYYQSYLMKRKKLFL